MEQEGPTPNQMGVAETNTSENKPQAERKPLTMQEKLFNVLHRKDAKEERAKVENLAEDLFNRVDTSKLLQDPELLYSAHQYRELLAIRNGVAEGKHNKQGYIENTAIRSTLEGIQKHWEEKNFLKEPEQGSEPKQNQPEKSPEDLADKRRYLKQRVDTSYDKVDKMFVRMQTEDFNDDFASEVGHITEALDLENDKSEFYPANYGYEPVEYDDAFLDAVAKRSQDLFDRQRQAVKGWVAESSKNETLFGKPYGEQEIEQLTESLAPKATIVEIPAPAEPRAA